MANATWRERSRRPSDRETDPTPAELVDAIDVVRRALNANLRDAERATRKRWTPRASARVDFALLIVEAAGREGDDERA